MDNRQATIAYARIEIGGSGETRDREIFNQSAAYVLTAPLNPET